MPPPTPTSIRSERAAWVALVVVTAVALGALAVTIGLGDQRRFAVVLSSPSAADQVPGTIREISLTFNREPDRAAIEREARFAPAIEGTVRWRGRTFAFVPANALPPGEYSLTLEAGHLGRNSEPLEETYILRFVVREPGLAAIVTNGQQQDLVEIRPDGGQRILVSAPRIIDYAVAPDGSEIAVVAADNSGHGGLALVPLAGGAAQAVVQDPEINIGGVAWAPDGSALLVIRRDRLPNGEEGVPRAWLLRRSGEFAGPIDPDGNPSLNPSWSPDGQHLAYISPSDARLVVRNLTTEETTVQGQPRGGAAAWSADSQALAFESVPPSTSSNPPQPVRVRSLDGVLDRTFGVPGEVRLAPKFWDATTIANLRRRIGVDLGGTDLLFESLEDGRVLRSISLTGGADLVVDWDLDASRRKIVYAVRSASRTTIIELDLESGQKRAVPAPGEDPQWIP